MSLTRRGLAGVAAGAMAATQMDKASTKSNWAPEPGYSASNEAKDAQVNLAQTKPDPEYYSKQIKRFKKILSGDFSGEEHRFEDNTRGRMYANVESLKSISTTARHHFLETNENKRRKRQMIEHARAQLDHILGLPFSVTGLLLFDE